MGRIEENKKMMNHFIKCAKEMDSGTYEEVVSWQLGAMNGLLADISKSLAVIADSMPKETVSERRRFME